MTVTKRKVKSSQVKPNRTGRELPEDILADSENIYVNKEPFYKRKRFHFLVGASVGLLAMYVASTTPVAQVGLESIQDYVLLQLADLDLPNLLPQSEIVDEFLGNFTHFLKPSTISEIPFMPAIDHKDSMDLKPHFPVVMIPGIVSSGLESWSTTEHTRKYFRKRMWGSMSMVRSVILDKQDWTENIMLDPITGLDPPGKKVRAIQGVEAADYFITGYWVWAKIIENLAAIGYDTNTMHFASYDWRLSFSNLEVRDQYFTQLQNKIELLKKSSGGKKSVIVTHSMGGGLFPYFLKWVENKQGGNGGSHWVDNHIESFVNIAGPLVGVPKAVTSLLSGETRDTMALGSFGAYVLEKFFSRRERASLMRSWFGGASMLPKGGSAVWGNEQNAPDDNDEESDTFGNMISFVPHPVGMNENSTETPSTSKDHIIRNYTVEASIDLLEKNSNEVFAAHLRSNYSFGLTVDKKQLNINENDPTKWSNPLESRLPNAPEMKIFCFYGVGVPTERSYYYAVADENVENSCEQDTGCTHEDSSEHESACTNAPKHPNGSKLPDMYIDATINNPIRRIETGIRFSDGDGTVPLLSLGYMCSPSGAWRKHSDLYNPGNSPVLLREYQNELSSSKLDVRGGPKASDHIDILGNWEMTLDLLKIVSNHSEEVKERIISPIEEYAKKVKLT